MSGGLSSRTDDPAAVSVAPAGDGEAEFQVQVIPAWLAAAVILLLLCAFGIGGFLLRGAVVRKQVEPSIRLQTLERELGRNPDSLDAMLELGFAYQRAGRYEEAIAQYDRVLSKDAKNTAALYNKGMTLMMKRRYKEAEPILWDVLEASKGHVLAAKALGEYYAAKHQYKSMLVAVEPAADLNPTSADLQYLVGLGYERLGDYRRAKYRYQQALKHVPDMKEAREGLKRIDQDEE